MKKDDFASIGGSVRPMTRCEGPCASTEGPTPGPKMRLINVLFLRTISEIKLKRTDTTLDLSQKATDILLAKCQSWGEAVRTDRELKKRKEKRGLLRAGGRI
jgi:hypothetical protein